MTLRRVLAALALTLIVAAGSSAQPSTPPVQQDEFVPISELPPQEQLPAQPLVIAAYAFAWVAVGGYVLSVARRLDSVSREIERLEVEAKRGR